MIEIMPVQEPEDRNRPDCWKCVYFKISWDPSKPYACQMMGFKSRMIPSFEVFRADGNHCRGFMVKIVQTEQLAVQPVPTVRKASRFLWKA
jgi:hypothetical protein